MQDSDKIIDFEKEKEVLKQVTDLIQEAKPLFFKEEKRKKNLSKICAAFLFIFISSAAFTLTTDNQISETIRYGESLCAQDYGFPVDSYGLIMVDDEF